MGLPTRDLLRHLWHMAGGMALPLAWLFWESGPVVAVACVLAAGAVCVEAARLLSPEVNRRLLQAAPILIKERERHAPSGSTYVLIGSALAMVLFPRPFAIVAMAYLAMGDASAALVGKSWGRHPILRGTKSVEGSAACLAVCVAVGLTLGTWSLGVGVAAILVGAVAATAIELFNFRIDDNVLIPVVCAGVMQALS